MSLLAGRFKDADIDGIFNLVERLRDVLDSDVLEVLPDDFKAYSPDDLIEVCRKIYQ